MFEQRARVGGVWDYHNETKAPPEALATLQSGPHHAGLAKPIWDKSGTKQVLGSAVEDRARFYTPLYDRLETNIPRSLMGFSDQDWPQDSQLFPKHETVTEYIEKYSEDVKHLISFQTQVLSVEQVEGSDNDLERWLVKTQTIVAGNEGQVTEGVYDAVVVASGHFSVPYVPQIKGMQEWSQKWPGVVSHSMYYKRPEDYQDQVSGPLSIR